MPNNGTPSCEEKPMRERIAVQENPMLRSLLTDIQYGDAASRMAAIKQARLVGTPAIGPLAALWGGADTASAKAAGEALKRIAHNAARPGAGAEAKAASLALMKLIGKEHPRHVRADSLYWLGFVGGSEAVPALAGQLGDLDIREDARMALERIPAPEAAKALQAALKSAPADFRPNIQQSLRHKAMKFGEVGKKR
jgi:HEAT repeat protein